MLLAAASDPKWWETLGPALLGLVGVLIGGLITYFATMKATRAQIERDEQAERLERKRLLLEEAQDWLNDLLQYVTFLHTLRKVWVQTQPPDEVWRPMIEHTTEMARLSFECGKLFTRMERGELRTDYRHATHLLGRVVKRPTEAPDDAKFDKEYEKASVLVGKINIAIGDELAKL